MIRVLMVEDEYWIRKGIIEAIDWETLDMEPAGEARNGAEALAILEKQPADIIITDMKMPEMSGDALLGELMRREYHGGLIVLSEYSDYQYMRQAIHAQVDEYMLKPIDERELNVVLLRIRNRLLTQNSQSEPMARLLSALVAGDRPPAGSVGTESVILTSVWAANLRAIPFGGKDIPDSVLHWYWFDEHEGVLLHACRKETPDFVPLLEETRKKWQLTSGGAVWLGVSGCMPACRAEQALAQAREAALYWHRDHPLVEYRQVMDCPKHDPLTFMLPKALELLLEHGQASEADQTACRLLDPFEHAEWVYLPALRNALLEFGLLLDHACRSKGINGPAAATQAQAVQAIHSPEEARSYLANLLQVALLAAAKQRFGCGDDVVEQIISYLRGHFADDLNLLGLSEQYHMNYIYLSRLFKKRTGVNFTDYLLKLRMEEARRLLRQGALRVKDVATMVGYPNAYYFSSSYQRYFNHSPSEEQRGENESHTR